MNTVIIYKGNSKIHEFKSSIIPPIGQVIWINGSADYYLVTAIVYDLIDSSSIQVTLIVE